MTQSRQSNQEKNKPCKPGLCTSYSSVLPLSAAKEHIPQPPTILTSRCSLHSLRIPSSSPCLPLLPRVCPSNTDSGFAPLTFCAGVCHEDAWGGDCYIMRTSCNQPGGESESKQIQCYGTALEIYWVLKAKLNLNGHHLLWDSQTWWLFLKAH